MAIITIKSQHTSQTIHTTLEPKHSPSFLTKTIKHRFDCKLQQRDSAHHSCYSEKNIWTTIYLLAPDESGNTNTMNRNISLLLVDSNELERENLSQELQLSGFNILRAETLKHAAQLSKEHQFNLAIIDYKTNDLSANNISTFTAYRIPFLFLASKNSADNEASPFAQRAVGHVVKPIHVSQLIAAIETALIRIREFNNLIQQQDNLKEALQQNREISIAIGILMAHTDYSYKETEDLLRSYARNSRQKMSHISTNIINAAETFNALLHKITKKSSRKAN